MLWPPDAQLARRDPNLPALPVLLDDRAFADALSAAAPHLGVVRASAHYVRYKPGTNCLVAYRVETSADRTIQLYVKAYRTDDRAKFDKSARPDISGGPLALPDILTLVRFFPDDGEMPSMKLLPDPGTRARLLERLLPDQPDCTNGTLRQLAYKPERRYVAQLSKPDGTPCGVLKLYSAGGFERISRNAKLSQAAQVLRVARRLGRSARHRALALEWMEGDLLVDRLGATDFDPAAVRRVGHALAELHAYRARQKLAPPVSREDEAAWLRLIAEAIGHAHPAAAHRAAELARLIGAWLTRRPCADRAIHGDFYSKQVLLQPGDTVAFLDLDEVRRGDPTADLGNFIAHLERHVLSRRLDPRRAQQVAHELRTGYANAQSGLIAGARARARAGGDVGDDAIRMYTAICLFHLSHQPFRDRQPGWPQHVDRILDRVEELSAATPAPAAVHVGHDQWRASDVPVQNDSAADHDPAMPFVRQALDPAFVQRALDDALIRPEWSNENFRLRAIRLVRHKPGRRCLIEYEVESTRGGGALLTLLGKARAKALDDSTFALNVALRDAGFADDAPDGIIVPEPVGMIAPLRMWLQRKMTGVSAMELLAGPAGASTGARLADVANKLHRAAIPTRRKHTTADELRILGQRLQELASRRSQWETRLQRLLDACRDLAADLSPGRRVCGVHRDYYPDQVLIDGDRAYLLDLDLYCEGDPALDIGNCVAHITEYALRTHGDPLALRPCEDAIIDRFARTNGTEAETAARIFAVLSLARHVHISNTFPDRAAFTERILELCEERTRTPVPA
jgi:hypothetical protein